MSDTPPAVLPAVLPTTAVSPAAPPAWFSGLDAEHIGYIQTKGWDKPDPAAAATEVIRAYREFERFRGVPQDEILRVPKDAADEAGWKAVWARLGAPEKAADYDFSAVKVGDETLTGKLHDAFRETAARLNMPKPMAEEYAKAAAKAFGEDQAAKAATEQANLAEQRTKLAENWGPEEGSRFKGNMFVADRAAERLGVTPEVMESLKNGLGGASVAEFFRKIGAGMGEDKLVNDPGPGGRAVMTREQAVDRKAELLGNGRTGSGDQEFIKRYSSGDAAARREIAALNVMIAAEV